MCAIVPILVCRYVATGTGFHGVCLCPNICVSICRYRDWFPWCVPVSQYLCVDMSLQGLVSMVCACVPISVCRYVATGTGFHGVCLCPNICVSICRYRDRFPWCVPVSQYLCVDMSLQGQVSMVCACVPISVCRYVATGTGFHGDDYDVGLNVLGCRVDILGTKFHGVCLCPSISVSMCRNSSMVCASVPISVL